MAVTCTRDPFSKFRAHASRDLGRLPRGLHIHSLSRAVMHHHQPVAVQCGVHATTTCVPLAAVSGQAAKERRPARPALYIRPRHARNDVAPHVGPMPKSINPRRYAARHMRCAAHRRSAALLTRHVCSKVSRIDFIVQLCVVFEPRFRRARMGHDALVSSAGVGVSVLLTDSSLGPACRVGRSKRRSAISHA